MTVRLKYCATSPNTAQHDLLHLCVNQMWMTLQIEKHLSSQTETFPKDIDVNPLTDAPWNILGEQKKG